MGYDGPQMACPACQWANFTIRTRCRNCDAPLVAKDETPEAERKRTLQAALEYTIDLCDRGFSSHDPDFYDTISGALQEHSADAEVAGMIRLCAAGHGMISKRFAYPHIQDAARRHLEKIKAAA